MLIFDNGTVIFDCLSTPPTFNASGDIEPTEKYEISVRCSIETASESDKTYEDGKVKSATYVVMLDMNSVPFILNSKGKITSQYVKLRHDRKGELGTFPVQRVEYYELTQSIGIWV